MKELNPIRRKIDRIDAELLRLLSGRAALAKSIGRIKSSRGEEFYLPHREKEILSRITRGNPGPLPSVAVRNIFSEILHSCRSVQARLKIAYPDDMISRVAALHSFGRYADYDSCRGIPEVLAALRSGRADYGVFPAAGRVKGARICSSFSLPLAGRKARFVVARRKG